jgi:hypothetical protein
MAALVDPVYAATAAGGINPASDYDRTNRENQEKFEQETAKQDEIRKRMALGENPYLSESTPEEDEENQAQMVGQIKQKTTLV